MVTIQIKNIEGKTVLPIAGTDRAAGYDIVATDEPNIVGEAVEYMGRTLYKRIDYIEYHTSVHISPNDTRHVTDGVPDHYHTLVYPRSSVRKYNLVLANSIGLIDNDYRGEILVCYKYIWQPEDYVIEMADVYDNENPEFVISKYVTGNLFGEVNKNKIYKKGDKIAQLVASQTVPCEYYFVNELDKTTRGEGGFGHTDLNPNPPKALGGYLTELYKQTGGIPTKQKYIDEVKQRAES